LTAIAVIADSLNQAPGNRNNRGDRKKLVLLAPGAAGLRQRGPTPAKRWASSPPAGANERPWQRSTAAAGLARCPHQTFSASHEMA